MYELFLYMISGFFLLYLFYTQVYPFIRKYRNYRKEREDLVKQYNRIWRSRKDLLVYYSSTIYTYAKLIYINRFISTGLFQGETGRETSRL